MVFVERAELIFMVTTKHSQPRILKTLDEVRTSLRFVMLRVVAASMDPAAARRVTMESFNVTTKFERKLETRNDEFN